MVHFLLGMVPYRWDPSSPCGYSPLARSYCSRLLARPGLPYGYFNPERDSSLYHLSHRRIHLLVQVCLDFLCPVFWSLQNQLIMDHVQQQDLRIVVPFLVDPVHSQLGSVRCRALYGAVVCCPRVIDAVPTTAHQGPGVQLAPLSKVGIDPPMPLFNPGIQLKPPRSVGLCLVHGHGNLKLLVGIALQPFSTHAVDEPEIDRLRQL